MITCDTEAGCFQLSVNMRRVRKYTNDIVSVCYLLGELCELSLLSNLQPGSIQREKHCCGVEAHLGSQQQRGIRHHQAR